MKKLSLSLLLLMGLTVSSIGSASSYTGNVSGTSTPLLTSLGGHNLDGSFSVANSIVGAFNDEWDFTLDTDVTLYDVATANNRILAFTFPGFSNPDSSINIADNTLIASLEMKVGTAWAAVASNLFISINDLYASKYNQLGLGDYRFLVSGTGTGTQDQGSYGFNVVVTDLPLFTTSSTPSPVPTPETWTLLLVGALLLGFQMRRNSSNQDSMLMAA